MSRLTKWIWVVGSAVVLAGCHAPNHSVEAEELPPAEVEFLKVSSQPLAVTEDVVGTVRSETRANVESKVSGRVELIEVDLGHRVKEGDILARIDAREVKARLDRAMADRDQAKRDWERAKTLLERQVASRAEFDTAEARYRAAEAAYKEAEALLAYVEVRAPFSGVIARRMVNPGDFAQPGRALFEIESPESLRFEIDVPEALIDFLTTGAQIQVTIPSLRRTITGTVAEVAPAADSGSRTFPVRITLPAVTGLRAGQFGRASITVGEQPGILIPAAAFTVRGQMEMVFVRDGGAIRLRLVRAGKVDTDQVEILSGLRDGEEIVAAGVASLQDGQPVAARP